MSTPVEVAAITQWCRQLHLPTIAGQCGRQAEHAAKAHQSHLAYLEALLEAEVEERERNVVARRLKEARLPKVKTLEDFDFTMAPQVSASVVRTLGAGDWIGRAEPVILLGDAGTGKTHLAIALAVIACRQRKRVRFTTAAELVNDLMEARHQHESSRVLARWMRYEVLVVDEMAYVTMPETAGELLFQVIAGRAERAAVIVTTNLPFSEWTTMFPNARLCKAMIDRLTDQAHIIETGTDSYRFRRTLARQRRAKGA